MSGSDQPTRWFLFHPQQIDLRYQAQARNATPLALRPFFSAEMARLSAGCSRDGFGISPTNPKFHSAWQKDAKTRAQTRAHGLHVIADMVRSLLFRMELDAHNHDVYR